MNITVTSSGAHRFTTPFAAGATVTGGFCSVGIDRARESMPMCGRSRDAGDARAAAPEIAAPVKSEGDPSPRVGGGAVIVLSGAHWLGPAVELRCTIAGVELVETHCLLLTADT